MRISSLLAGLVTAFFSLGMVGTALSVLLYSAPSFHWGELWAEPFFQHILGFSFLQALLSTLIATILAIPIARALFYTPFLGRNLLLKLCSLTLVLPAMVVVFGLTSVYGQQGFVATVCHWFGIHYSLSLYGLPGILIAHSFFNLPLATRVLLQALEAVPIEQRQLAAQLNIASTQLFYRLEWPWMKQSLWPTAALIFMLCFTSFTLVLTLGGGPKATTLELAIYQALNYDFDTARAAMLAIIQLCCCLGVLVVSLRFASPLASHASLQQRRQVTGRSRLNRMADSCWILVLILLLVPPLTAVCLDGLSANTLTVLMQPTLWQVIATSLQIAITAGLLSVILTVMLILTSRELKIRQYRWAAQLFDISGMLVLSMPGIVLATGFFLLFSATVGVPESALYILIAGNALLALPYAQKILDQPMYHLAVNYNWLAQNLGITGWKRLQIIEWRALRRPLGRAFSFSCALSLGDFGLIALFGNDNFRTLPFYLFQQIGAYRSNDAAVTALILLLLSLLLSSLIEKLANTHDKT